MLSSLLIKNYALIGRLEMHPAAGLNTITGETGAGKSIMLGAIGLLMGKRADTSVLLQKEQKCIVEGTFQIGDYALEGLFEQHDWDYEAQTIIRREISSSGKSRAFVNDSPVKLEALRSLGEHLLDVHSQNDTMKLRGKEFQLDVLDVYGNNLQLLEQYQKEYDKWVTLKKEHQQLLIRATEQQKEADYQNFLLDELERANLDPNEQLQLEESLRLMENAEEIKQQIQQSLLGLEDGDYSVNQQLTSTTRLLSRIAEFGSHYQSLKERLESCLIEIRDVAQELHLLDQQVEYDATAIEALKGKLDTIYRLQRKHSVESIKELVEIRDQLKKESDQLLHLDHTLSVLEQQIEDSETKLLKLGAALKIKREETFPEFKQHMEDLLGKLGMPESSLTIATRETSPKPHGVQEIQWLFSANKGVKVKPIKQVASGGEFSRIMFCVKYLIADKVSLPTILFDEIDSGISGEVALQMIEMMQSMARTHQVIVITHLPQIAARGDHHYFVFKESDQNSTTSTIKLLSEKQRIEAVARMIGGNKPSEIAYANARELMGIGEYENGRMGE
jgi:DNA repair protein RecN (Recombination protein N)